MRREAIGGAVNCGDTAVEPHIGFPVGKTADFERTKLRVELRRERTCGRFVLREREYDRAHGSST